MSTRKSLRDVTATEETSTSALDFQRLAHFRYRLRCFMRQSESACQENGTTPLQYQLLLQLKGGTTREWATIGELAEQLQAKHHGVVALVNRCVKLGLVERRPGREDRRQVEVHLTPEGEALLLRIALLHQDELKLLRDEFSASVWP